MQRFDQALRNAGAGRLTRSYRYSSCALVRSVISVRLTQVASLSYVGTLAINGTLVDTERLRTAAHSNGFGTLRCSGSIDIGGTLTFIGSFHFFGTHTSHDSIRSLGTLRSVTTIPSAS